MILLIDESADQGEAASRALQGAGHRTVSAKSMAQAIHHLSLVEPDAIVFSPSQIPPVCFRPWSLSLGRPIPMVLIHKSKATSSGPLACVRHQLQWPFSPENLVRSVESAALEGIGPTAKGKIIPMAHSLPSGMNR